MRTIANFLCRDRLVLVLIVALWGYSPTCLAQNSSKRHFEFYLAGGSSTITDVSSKSIIDVGFGNQVVEVEIKTKTHVHPSGRFMAGFRYFLTPRDALEASYSYAPANVTLSLTDTLTTPTGSTIALISVPPSVRSHLYSLNYVRRFRAEGRLQPYLTAGIGGVYWQAIPASQLPPAIQNAFAGNFGAGIDWNVSSHWGLRAEYRDYLVDHPQFEALAPGGMSHDQSPTIGVVYRF